MRRMNRWERLAGQLKAARFAAGLTQAEIAEQVGVGVATWVLLENAKQDSYKEHTLAKIESGLSWQPGTITRILRDPKFIPASEKPSEEAGVLADIRAELREIRRLLESAEGRGEDAGSGPHP